MAGYDYVQIVVDTDWGLVGIVPPGGAGERVKKLSLPSTVTKAELIKSPEPKAVETIIPNQEVKRKPLAQIITRHEPVVETVKKPEKIDESTRTNPHTLSGINGSTVIHRPAPVSNYEQFPEIFGNVSSRATVRSRDNLLIGFGR